MIATEFPLYYGGNPCKELGLSNPRKVINDLPKGVTNSYPLSTIKPTIYFISSEHIFNINK